jgi:3-hydroxybutyryl-CoA dehydrogenase
MNEKRIGTGPIGIVGTGQMGRGIAQTAVAAGLVARLHDSRAGAARTAADFVAQMLTRAAEKGRMSRGDAAAAIGRLQIVDTLEGLAGCRIVVEAIVEELEAKRQLFAALEEVVDEDCILATNTSSLSVTAIAAACRRPERCAGFHFFNPVPLMKVVEVIDGLRSAASTVDALVALANTLGHRPVRAKDSPGFLVNHAGRGYVTEALRVLGEGVAGIADIDRVMREAGGFPMGPFELLDLTGLDVSDPVIRSIYHQFFEEPRFRPSALTAPRVAAGLFGRKSDEGFYRYVDGARQEPPEPALPAARPDRVWVSPADPAAQQAILALLAPLGITVATSRPPAPGALLLVTPFGEDATDTALAQRLDPARTVAVDTLIGLDRRVTLMATPLTTAAMRDAARGLFGATGRTVTLIADRPGFIAQRIMASVVNVASEIAQLRIATPDDIDAAVRLGLGYPEGPLALGDRIGPARILAILEALQRITGDPRYRPSLWLRRRARLGVSLATPDLAD